MLLLDREGVEESYADFHDRYDMSFEGIPLEHQELAKDIGNRVLFVLKNTNGEHFSRAKSASFIEDFNFIIGSDRGTLLDVIKKVEENPDYIGTDFEKKNGYLDRAVLYFEYNEYKKLIDEINLKT